MASGLALTPGSAGSEASEARPAPQRKTVLVAYFLTSTRCFFCYKIEPLIESAAQNAFGGPLREARLQWRTISTDEPKNDRSVKDCELITKSAIVLAESPLLLPLLYGLGTVLPVAFAAALVAFGNEFLEGALNRLRWARHITGVVLIAAGIYPTVRFMFLG